MKILTSIILVAIIAVNAFAQRWPVPPTPYDLPAPALATPFGQYILDNGTDAPSILMLLNLPASNNIVTVTAINNGALSPTFNVAAAGVVNSTIFFASGSYNLPSGNSIMENQFTTNVNGNIPATLLTSGTVPLARLSGITSNQLDAATWQLTTNLNGGNAALATNVVSGIGITGTFTGNGSNLNLSTTGVSAAGAAINWGNTTIFGGAQTILRLQQVKNVFLIPDSKSVTLLHSNAAGDKQGWFSYGGFTNSSTPTSITNQLDGSIWYNTLNSSYNTNNRSWGITITNLFSGLGYNVALDTACAVPGGLLGYLAGGYGSSNNTYVPAGYGGNYDAIHGTYTNTINQGQDITWWPLSASDISITMGGVTYTTNVGKNVTLQVAGTFGSSATFITAGTPGAGITAKITQHYYPGQNTPNYWPPYTGTGFGGPLSTPPLNWITVSNSVAATGKQFVVLIMGPDNDFNGPVGDYSSLPSATNQVQWAVTNAVQDCLAIRAAGGLVVLGTSPLNYNEAQSPGVLFSNILDYNRQITAMGKNPGVCDVFIDWASTNSIWTNISGAFIDGTHWSSNTAAIIGTNAFTSVGGLLLQPNPTNIPSFSGAGLQAGTVQAAALAAGVIPSTSNLLNTNGNNGSPAPAGVILIGTNISFPNGFGASQKATVVGADNVVQFQASGVAVIGSGNNVSVNSAIAVGVNNTVAAQSGGTFGNGNLTSGNGSWGFGNAVIIGATALEAGAFGHSTTVNAANSFSLIGGNTITASATNSIQLGYATTSLTTSNTLRLNDGLGFLFNGNNNTLQIGGFGVLTTSSNLDATKLTGAVPTASLNNISNVTFNAGTPVSSQFLGVNASGNVVMGTPSAGGGGSTATNFFITQNTNGFILSTNATSVVLQQRVPLGFFNFPVPSWRPASSNFMAMDLMPNMEGGTNKTGGGTNAPASTEGAITWLDLCNNDILTNGTSAVATARLGMYQGFVGLQSVAYNGAPQLPLNIGLGTSGNQIAISNNSPINFNGSIQINNGAASAGVTLNNNSGVAGYMRLQQVGTTTSFWGEPTSTSFGSWDSTYLAANDIVLGNGTGKLLIGPYGYAVPGLVMSSGLNRIPVNTSMTNVYIGGVLIASNTISATTNTAAYSTITNAPSVTLATSWTNIYAGRIQLIVDGTLNMAVAGTTTITFTNLTTLEGHIVAGSTLSIAGTTYFSDKEMLSPNDIIQYIAANTGTATTSLTGTTVKKQ